ncbi:Dynamitin-domain-containing protein [Chytridium lagenaria]|nr:Dynamitin-domain-containing protein [Chytridium lagenaria]
MFEVEQLEVDMRKGSEEVELVSSEGVEAVEVPDVTEDQPQPKKKKERYPHKMLMDQVSKRMEGGLDPAVYTEGDSAVGSLVRQTEYQKKLIAHLNAYKAASRAKEDNTEVETTKLSPPLTTTNPDMVTYELFYTPENAKFTQLAKISDIEKRLTNVERLLGVHLLQGIESGDDPLKSILLTSGNNVSRRVKTVTSEMERLIELRKKQQQEHQNARFLAAGSAASAVSDLDMHATQTETERKVDYLFTSLDKLDPVIGGLHTEASVFADSLKLVDGEQKKVADTAKTMDEALKGLVESVKENSDRAQKNFEALQERVSAIVGKIEKAQVQDK